MQHLDGGAGVGEGTVIGRLGDVEVLGQGGEPAVGHLVARQDAAGEADRVDHVGMVPPITEGVAGATEEPDVEARVVSHDDAATRELKEGGQHLLQRWGCRHHRVRDPRQDADEGRDVDARVDQRLKLADDLVAADLDGPHLRDRVVGAAARGLEVDHAEGHRRQLAGQVSPWWPSNGIPWRARSSNKG